MVLVLAVTMCIITYRIGYNSGSPNRIVILRENVVSPPIQVQKGDLVIIFKDNTDNFTSYRPADTQWLEYIKGIGFVD
jgi:hypothetical protein